MARLPKASTAKGHCDILARRLVKHRAGGRCERCGEERLIEWAHIIRRSYAVTRCNPLNGWGLCRECHTTVDHNPAELMRLVDETIGREAYDALHEVAMAGLQGTGMSARMFWYHTREELKRQCLTIGINAHNKRSA